MKNKIFTLCIFSLLISGCGEKIEQFYNSLTNNIDTNIIKLKYSKNYYENICMNAFEAEDKSEIFDSGNGNDWLDIYHSSGSESGVSYKISFHFDEKSKELYDEILKYKKFIENYNEKEIMKISINDEKFNPHFISILGDLSESGSWTIEAYIDRSDIISDKLYNLENISLLVDDSEYYKFPITMTESERTEMDQCLKDSFAEVQKSLRTPRGTIIRGFGE